VPDGDTQLKTAVWLGCNVARQLGMSSFTIACANAPAEIAEKALIRLDRLVPTLGLCEDFVTFAPWSVSATMTEQYTCVDIRWFDAGPPPPLATDEPSRDATTPPPPLAKNIPGFGADESSRDAT